MSDYEIRPFRPGDEESLLACFNDVFSRADPAFVPRTMAQWEWGYVKNPAGQRIMLALKDGEVVGHYGAYPYRVIAGGEPTHFSQITDSFVHPDHRRGLKRPGLFVQMGLEYLAKTTGPGRDIATFGWPIEDAWRIGQKAFRYEIVRSQLLFGREPGGAAGTGLPADVVELERFDDSVLPLYERCRPGWGASIVRDAAYLNWRYFDNPYHAYRAFGIRAADGSLAGAFVYRHGGFLVPNMGLLLDWLVPVPKDGDEGGDGDGDEVAGALHEAFLALCRADGVSFAGALFVEWSPWFARFQELGWRLYPSEWVTVVRRAGPYDMKWMRNHWWYQLGETDWV